MADDDNANAAELPHSEEESGDIEQGIIISENTDGLRSSSSWVAAAITGGTTSTPTPSTTTTSTWPPGELEQVDLEDAAPVPLIQQIADMGIEKDDLHTNINTNVAREDVSMTMTPQPPAQVAMEEIEDGDDSAPLPFNYANTKINPHEDSDADDDINGDIENTT